MNPENLEKLFGDAAALQTEYIIADRSKVQQYADCPFQAWYCTENNIEPNNDILNVGKELHALKEECIKTGIEDQALPEDMADWFIEELPSVRPDIQPKAIKMARYLAEDLAHLHTHRIIGVEMQIDDAGKTGLKNIKGIPFKLTACLDLLLEGRNSLIVVDDKNGFKKRSNEEAFNDFQAQFDSVILWDMYSEIDVIHWFFNETFWGTKAYARFDRNAEYPSMPHLTQEAQFRGRIFSALKLWQEDCRQTWPEQKKCAWCSCVLNCPAANAGAKAIASNARKFVDRMVALEAQLNEYKAIAKYWLRNYGSLKGSDMVFEWRQSSKFTPKLYKLIPPPKGD